MRDGGKLIATPHIEYAINELPGLKTSDLHDKHQHQNHTLLAMKQVKAKDLKVGMVCDLEGDLYADDAKMFATLKNNIV